MILCVPASSSSSERLFSIAGLFDTVKRGTMSLETLETLTLLKTNQKVLKDNNVNLDAFLGVGSSGESSASEESTGEESELDIENDTIDEPTEEDKIAALTEDSDSE